MEASTRVDASQDGFVAVLLYGYRQKVDGYDVRSCVRDVFTDILEERALESRSGNEEQNMRSSWIGSLLLAIVLAVAAQASGQANDYAKERADRAKGLTTPYGWFSLVALDWLKPGTSTVGAAKDNSIVLAAAPAHLMTLEQKDGKVTLLKADPSLSVQGKQAGSGALIGDGEDDAAALATGTIKLWAIDRGGKRYLRVKDSEAPALKHFHGLSWYAPDQKYRIEAKWVPYTTPHTLQVMNKLGQITPTKVPGYVEFELNGMKQLLTPMESDKDGLFFVFRDATSRKTTDQGGRFLSTSGPSAGLDKPGTLTIDFNEAVNPPCAYSPYATCPLASPENRLPVPVNAGEKRYEE